MKSIVFKKNKSKRLVNEIIKKENERMSKGIYFTIYLGKYYSYNILSFFSWKFIVKQGRTRYQKQQFKLIFKLLASIFSFRFVNGKNNTNNLLLVTSSNSVKVFNFIEGIVITKLDDDKKNKVNFTKLTFGDSYKTPHIKIEKNIYLIEKLIEFIPHNKLSNSDKIYVMEELLRYKKKYTKANEHKIKRKFNISKQILIKLPICIQQKIYSNQVFQQKIVFELSHGDIWSNNILYTKSKEVFVIDWDHSRYQTFIYDTLSLIIFNLIFHNDKYLYKKYLEGAFDKYLTEIFKYNDFAFKDEEKMTYLIAVIMERIDYFYLIGEDISRYIRALNTICNENI